MIPNDGLVSSSCKLPLSARERTKEVASNGSCALRCFFSNSANSSPKVQEPYGATWSHMEPYGAIWSHMEPYGATWSHMEPHGATWSHMEPYGAIWSHMEPYGAIWSHMEPHGATWSHMEPHGAIWSHMEPYGAIMEPYGAIMEPYGAIMIIIEFIEFIESSWHGVHLVDLLLNVAHCLAFSLVPGSSFTVHTRTHQRNHHTSSHKMSQASNRFTQTLRGNGWYLWAFALFDISQTKGCLHRAANLVVAKTPLDSDMRARVDEQLLVQA